MVLETIDKENVSFMYVRVTEPGRSIPVVHLLWEQVDRVRFSAARLIYGANNTYNSLGTRLRTA